jgi:hypothetical protein
LIAKCQRRLPGFDDKAISMYARGMNVRDIQGHLRKLYGIEGSPQDPLYRDVLLAARPQSVVLGRWVSTVRRPCRDTVCRRTIRGTAVLAGTLNRALGRVGVGKVFESRKAAV